MIADIKKDKRILLVIIVLLIATIGITAAYFQSQIGSGANSNVIVTTKTTDVLTFSKGNDISITATQANFYSGAGNRTGSTSVTASLRANNDTNSATQNYNVYLLISTNDFEYTTQSQTAELLLTITNPNNQTVTSLTGLTYKTVNGVSGFDITTQTGVIQIASNYAITSSSSTTATNQSWNITVTFINLNSDQQANTSKTFTALAIIQKDELGLPYIGTIYRNDNDYVPIGTPIAPGMSPAYYILSSSFDSRDYSILFESQSDCLEALATVDEAIQAGELLPGVYTCEENDKYFDVYIDEYNNVYYPDDSPFYNTEAECLADIENQIENNNWSGIPTDYVCSKGIITNPEDAILYTTDSSNIAEDTYLKHEVVNGIITQSEVCIKYDNNEFCLGPNYWEGTIGVNDSAAGLATMNKLQTAMEIALGTSVSSCSSSNHYAYCYFENYSCTANSNGTVFCESPSGFPCEANSYGTTYCGLA